MAIEHDSTQTTVFVAIDVSRDRNDILIQQPSKRSQRMKITNERVDHASAHSPGARLAHELHAT